MSLVSREKQVERRREVRPSQDCGDEERVQDSPLEREVERRREVWEWSVFTINKKEWGCCVHVPRCGLSSMFSVILNVVISRGSWI